MDHPTLYERLGGAVGIDAVVRAVHDRLLSDPDHPTTAGRAGTDAAVLADIAVLARLLGGPWTARAADDAGVLLAEADVARRHLADALWLLGTSSGLAADVVGAVLEEQRRVGAPTTATSGGMAP